MNKNYKEMFLELKEQEDILNYKINNFNEHNFRDFFILVRKITEEKLMSYGPGSCLLINQLEFKYNVLPFIKKFLISKKAFLTYGAVFLYNDDEIINFYDTPSKEDYLKNPLSTITNKNTFKIHAWITFDSGEILDLAHPISCYSVFKEILPIFGEEKEIKETFYLSYEPFIIVEEFDI